MKLLSKNEIKELLKKKGVTMVEIASRIGISPPSFHQRLNTWNEKKQIELFKLLGIPVENVMKIGEPSISYAETDINKLQNYVQKLSAQLAACEKERQELYQINKYLNMEIMNLKDFISKNKS